jgi:hypothetical protein
MIIIYESKMASIFTFKKVEIEFDRLNLTKLFIVESFNLFIFFNILRSTYI